MNAPRHTAVSRIPHIAASLMIAAIALPSTVHARANKAPKQTLPPPEMNRDSSRFISPDDIAGYLKTMVPTLEISSRELDPFCRPQDPDAKPVIANPLPDTRRAVPTPQAVPFSEIVSRIKINTVMPGEKRFLISGRSFKEGDSMTVTYRMKPIRTEVLSVSASRIVFKKSDTGETAAVSMNLLPEGMSPGAEVAKAPGVFKEQKDAPIVLDPPTLPTSEELTTNPLPFR